jgi:hypothetical protein
MHISTSRPGRAAPGRVAPRSTERVDPCRVAVLLCRPVVGWLYYGTARHSRQSLRLCTLNCVPSCALNRTEKSTEDCCRVAVLLCRVAVRRRADCRSRAFTALDDLRLRLSRGRLLKGPWQIALSGFGSPAPSHVKCASQILVQPSQMQ